MEEIKLEKLNAFDSVYTDDNNAALPILTGKETASELLDYMVIVITRRLCADKAFKGGYMLNQLLGSDSRRTSDVDFSVASEKVYEQVKAVLEEIAVKFSEVDLISSYEIKENISPTSSGGVKFYNKVGEQFLGVDVGMHDIAYGIRHYDFDVAALDGFEIERMLADKLIAILSRKRFRRTKDLYDFYAITSLFDFDYEKLQDYVERRGGAEWDNIPFSEVVIEQYRKAWDKLTLIGFESGSTLSKPSFEVVIERYYTVAIPMKAKKGFKRWEHLQQRLI